MVTSGVGNITHKYHGKYHIEVLFIDFLCFFRGGCILVPLLQLIFQSVRANKIDNDSKECQLNRGWILEDGFSLLLSNFLCTLRMVKGGEENITYKHTSHLFNIEAMK